MKIVKTIYKLCAAVLVSSAFWGCVQEEPQMPEALLAASSMTFEAVNAEPQTLTVASDDAWVVDAPEWISVDPMSGTNTVEVTVSVTDNVDGAGKLAAPREGVITIKNANSDYTITTKVLQKGDTYLGAPEVDLAGLAALEDGSRAKATESQVVALASNGFIATDESATMYILGNQDKVKLGDKVTMNGTVATEYGIKVFNSDEVAAVAGELAEPEAKDVTENISKYQPTNIEYVKISGTLIGSALRVGDVMGAATLFSPALDLEEVAVHKVVAYGYALLNDGKTLHFVPVKFEDKGLDESLTFYPITYTFAKGENLTFETDNRFEPETGLGYISYVPVNLEATNKNNKFARTIGGTGEPYVTGGWPGDYWLFTGYGAVKAGSEVSITFESRTSKSGHKFWRLEYLDGENWKIAGEAKTTSEPGEEIIYTHAQNNDGSTNIVINESFKLNKNVDQLQIRFLCMANWQSGYDDNPLEARNGGTTRLSVSEKNGYIYPKIEILKEGDGVERPDTDPVYANVSVSAELVTFEGTPEGPQTLTIVSDHDFRISENISWLDIDVTGGLAEEETVVTLTCQPSELSTLRRGEIEITSESTKKIVHVVQSAAGQILAPFMSIVGGNSGNVNFEEGSFNIEVQSNVDYEFSSDASWVTVEAAPLTRALVETKTIAVNYQKNEVEEERVAHIRVYNTEENIETIYTLTQAAFVSGIYFQDDFTWIAPWVDNYGGADSVGENDPSGSAANVYTQKTHLDGGTPGVPAFLTEFKARGYEDLNPASEVLYTQKYYLKFGKTSHNTGIKLPAIDFGATPVDAVVKFNWACHRRVKSGVAETDPVNIVVEVLDASGESIFVSDEFVTTQPVDKMEWQDAEVLLSNITSDMRIVIRPFNMSPASGAVNRWYVDNIKVVKPEPVFSETFDWIAPWADAGSASDSVAENDPSGTALNVYTHASCKANAVPSGISFLDEFTRRGYVDLNPASEVIYTQKYYLKFGKTSHNTGIKLPEIDFGTTPRDVVVKFNWACHRRVKSGVAETDPVNIVVEVLDADGNSVFVSDEFVTTQPVDVMKWQDASVTLTNITSANRIVIRPSNMKPASGAVNRWYIDNINIY